MPCTASHLLIVFGLLIPLVSFAAADSKVPLQVVPSVDLNRYMGTWHEIARLPNKFQRKCAGDTTAVYTLLPDGKITVLNSCRTPEGKITSAKGKAHVADKNGPNTKLKVTFFWPFYGNYWIIDLDPDYKWVVVGEPGRKYLWVLGRETRMDESLYQQILERIKQQGYDAGPMIKAGKS
jgi:apolipoprotein D and lipocalin family protein